MEPSIIEFCHNIEQERVSVVVQSLVIEKEFRQQTKILSVALVLAAVDLEEGNRVLAVDLVAGRISQIAFGDVTLETFAALAILQTELANVDALQRTQLLGIRREVPRFDPMLSQLDELNVFHPRNYVVMIFHHAARLTWRLLRGLLRVVIN